MACIRTTPARRLTPSPARAEAGFSLTEVLVTLSIVAFASAMIVGTSRPADPLKQEAEQLTQTMAQLDARARMTGEPLGLVLEAGRYSGAAWIDGAWTALPRATRDLPKGIEVVSPAAAPRDDRLGEEGSLQPQLVFDPLGHSDTVEVLLRSGQRELAVQPPQRGTS